jgi:hypothetical protein
MLSNLKDPLQLAAGGLCYTTKVDNESKVRKGYHRAWQIHYHIVFPVKYRKSLLDEEVVQIIRETATSIEERYEIEMETMGMDRDHIHLLCGAHPKLSPGRIGQIFKSITCPGDICTQTLSQEASLGW